MQFHHHFVYRQPLLNGHGFQLATAIIGFGAYIKYRQERGYPWVQIENRFRKDALFNSTAQAIRVLERCTAGIEAEVRPVRILTPYSPRHFQGYSELDAFTQGWPVPPTDAAIPVILPFGQ